MHGAMHKVRIQNLSIHTLYKINNLYTHSYIVSYMPTENIYSKLAS